MHDDDDCLQISYLEYGQSNLTIIACEKLYSKVVDVLSRVVDYFKVRRAGDKFIINIPVRGREHIINTIVSVLRSNFDGVVEILPGLKMVRASREQARA